MKTIILECSSCGKSFERALKEYNRTNVKGGRKPYCSLKCSGKENNSHLEKWQKLPPGRNCIFSKDEYSPYREHMRRVKNRQRDKGKEVDVDKEYLKEVFEQQKGVCIYSGVELEHREGVGVSGKSNPLTAASLDRIDSSKGYIKGNVQFISIVCNHAKNGMSDKQMREWIEIVKK